MEEDQPAEAFFRILQPAADRSDLVATGLHQQIAPVHQGDEVLEQHLTSQLEAPIEQATLEGGALGDGDAELARLRGTGAV